LTERLQVAMDVGEQRELHDGRRFAVRDAGAITGQMGLSLR